MNLMGQDPLTHVQYVSETFKRHLRLVLNDLVRLQIVIRVEQKEVNGIG